MASLADLPELVGFFSYSRKDDLDSEGALSRLRSRIQSELRLQLGRDYRLWQDTAAIPEGALWEDEIQRAISESVFFIPIITPSSIASGHCRREFESFRDRERALGRNDLIFPILYVTVKQLESEEAWRQDALLNLIGQRQYFDYRPLRRFRDLTPEVSFKIEVFCSNICNALHRPARTNPGLAATADQQVSANLAPSAPTAAAGQMAAPAAPPLDAPPAARDYAARRDAVDVKMEQVQQPPPPPPLPSSANRQIKRGRRFGIWPWSVFFLSSSPPDVAWSSPP